MKYSKILVSAATAATLTAGCSTESSPVSFEDPNHEAALEYVVTHPGEQATIEGVACPMDDTHTIERGELGDITSKLVSFRGGEVNNSTIDVAAFFIEIGSTATEMTVLCDTFTPNTVTYTSLVPEYVSEES